MEEAGIMQELNPGAVAYYDGMILCGSEQKLSR